MQNNVYNKWEYLEEEYESQPRYVRIQKRGRFYEDRPLTDFNVGRQNRHNRAMRKLKELANG